MAYSHEERLGRRVSRLRQGLAVLGVAAAAWLLPGEALASAPTSKPPTSKAKPQKAPEKAPADAPEQDTKQARALLEKAKPLIKRKQFAEAARLTRRCVEVASGYPECHLRHGTVLAMQGNADEGAKHYRRFVELAPDAPEASKVRALLRQYDEHRAGKH